MPQEIARQWDVGSSLFSTARASRDLVRAGSLDDVQPQAVVAFMRLGATLQVSGRRRNEGIDALGGSGSIRLDNFKIIVGYISGNIASKIRQHTPGVKAFLLLTALNIWCKPEVSGDTIYEMLDVSGIADNDPASSQQMERLAETLSAYSYELRDSVSQHLVLVNSAILGAFCRVRRQSTLGEIIQPRDTAEILTSVFEGLADQDVAKITMSGVIGGTYLATLLSWMLDEEACVMVDDQVVFGNHDAKLQILLPTEAEQAEHGWVIQRWSATCHVTNIMTFTIKDEASIRDTSFILGGATRLWFMQRFPDCDETQTNIIGEIAGTIFSDVVQRGQVNNGFGSLSTKISELGQSRYIHQIDYIMESFGWSKSTLSNQGHILKLVGNQIETLSSFDVDTYLGILKKAVLTSYPTLDTQLPQPWVIEDFLNYGILIATSALSLLMSSSEGFSFGKEFQYRPVLSCGDLRLRKRLVDQIFNEKGCPVHEFRKFIFAAIFGHSVDDFRGDELFVERNGLVSYARLTTEPSDEQRMALALAVRPGSIILDNKSAEKCRTVRDVASESMSSDSYSWETYAVRPYETSMMGRATYRGLTEKHDWPVHYAHLKIFQTVRGQDLLIKSSLVFDAPGVIQANSPSSSHSGKIERSFSWINALEGLACAKHLMIPSSLTITAEETAAKHLFARGIFTSTLWLAPSSLQRRNNTRSGETKFLVCTGGDVMVRLLHVSVSATPYVLACGTNLITAISEAEQLGVGNWVIVL